MTSHIAASRGTPGGIGGGVREDDSGEVISAGKYVPFGYTDSQQIVADIKRYAASSDGITNIYSSFAMLRNFKNSQQQAV